MAFTLFMLAVLLFGLILVALGGVLLGVLKKKLAGWIVLVFGILTATLSILGYLFLVITSTTMG